MKKNVGKKDRSIRIPLGILIIMAGIYFQNWWGLAGLILLVTGLAGVCPVYSLFGISTCKTPSKLKL